MAFPEETPDARESGANDSDGAQPQPAEDAAPPEAPAPEETQPDAVSADELLPEEPAAEPITMEDAALKAVLEAIIYVTDEPLSLDQICAAIEHVRGPDARAVGVGVPSVVEFETGRIR